MNTRKSSRLICWIISIFGLLFTLVGLFFLLATIIDMLAPPALKEPYSPYILPSITAFFLVIGAGILSFGIMGIRRSKW